MAKYCGKLEVTMQTDRSDLCADAAMVAAAVLEGEDEAEETDDDIVSITAVTDS
jgi:hypothetical protein